MGVLSSDDSLSLVVSILARHSWVMSWKISVMYYMGTDVLYPYRSSTFELQSFVFDLEFSFTVCRDCLRKNLWRSLYV